jgi:hypothetical protein
VDVNARRYIQTNAAARRAWEDGTYGQKKEERGYGGPRKAESAATKRARRADGVRNRCQVCNTQKAANGACLCEE